jgi:hypothetical protein
VGTVYRSDHSKWLHGTKDPTRTNLPPYESSRQSHRSNPQAQTLRGLLTWIGARPQLWKVLWTESAVPGRRPT